MFGLDEEGQDIAEYAVMLAVILVICGGHSQIDRLECQQCVLAGWECASVAAPRLVQNFHLRMVLNNPPKRSLVL